MQKEGLSLPSCGIVPDDEEVVLKYPSGDVKIVGIDKKFSEQIYNELPDIPSDDGDGGDGQGKEEKDGKGLSKDGKVIQRVPKGFDSHETSAKGEGNEDKQKWENITRQAVVIAKNMGNLSGSLEGFFDRVFVKRINWKTKLYRFISNTLVKDYTYALPSKKSQSIGSYLPSSIKEDVEVVAAIDTSGSMGQDELNEINAQLIEMARTFSNLKLRIIECDATITFDKLLQNGVVEKLRKMEVRGGGGTSFLPVYTHIKQKYPTTKLLIFFTDGYGEYPDKEYIPTLWVITKGGMDIDRLPFGDKIKME
jgi:predicted metal-dependent peptidase